MPVRRLLGGGWTYSVSFWPFLNSSSWFWLISSVFLTRTSCHKTSHVSCYCGAWPGWVVSVSVLPLTTTPWETSYSRYFLGIGAEVSFFCNFFLLCMGGGLPTEQKSLSTWSMSRYSLPETSIHPCNNSNLAWNCWPLSEMKQTGPNRRPKQMVITLPPETEGDMWGDGCRECDLILIGWWWGNRAVI